MENSIPTNDAFKDICLLLRVHKDKDYLISLFESKGWNVSKAKLKGWSTRAGDYNKDFRAMPTEAFKDFIEALKDAKLVEDESEMH